MSAVPQQRDVAMFGLGLRDYGSSWTRLQEALRVQQQMYGPVRQEELPQPSPPARSDDGSEEKTSSKGKSRAGLIGLITRKKDGKKKDKRSSKSPERKAKEHLSEDDASTKPESLMEASSLKRPARKETPNLFVRTQSSEKEADVPDAPREKSQSPKSFSRMSENFDSDERLSTEDFRNNGDAGSPGDEFLVNGKRRQDSPSERESWEPKIAADDDPSLRKSARAPAKIPRGHRRNSPDRERDEVVYRRPRQQSFREDFYGEDGHDENFNHREPQRRPNDPVHRQRSSRQQYTLSDPPYQIDNGEPLAEQSLNRSADEPEPIRPSREADRVIYRREVVEQSRGQSHTKPAVDMEPHRSSREADRPSYRREEGEPRRGHSLTRPTSDVEPRRPSREAERTRHSMTRPNSDVEPHLPSREAERARHSMTRPNSDVEPHLPSREAERVRHSMTRPNSDVEPHLPSREAERARHSMTRPNSDVEPHLPSREAERTSYRRDDRDVARGHSLTRNETEPQRPSREADKAGYHREDTETRLGRSVTRQGGVGDSEPHRPSREADRTSHRREQHGPPPRGPSLTRPTFETEPHRPPREVDRVDPTHRRELSPYRQEADDFNDRRSRLQEYAEARTRRDESQARLRDYSPMERRPNGRLDSTAYKNRQQTDREQRVSNRADRQSHMFKEDALERNKDHDEWSDRDGRQQQQSLQQLQRRDGRADPEPRSPLHHQQQQQQQVQATDNGVRPLGCTRCGDRVYPKEMVTPKPGVLLHSGCFKCRECNVKLTLQTFFTNQRDTRDADVYCRTHVPRLGPGTVDGNALNILTSKNSREIKFSRYPKASDTELSSQDDG
ncbi:microtubule-associated protein futsch [Dermacentor silvarum]|uniref:microtubule-associated protein futsch n=1 Tax=Dermacentor silvarum TaxID=543639 RepID=UPI00189B3E19|nr:microtubule-associated protein futsch [Dermacentor silvarum]